MSRYINGQWLKSSGLPFSSHNPATGDTLWQGHEATTNEVNEAMQAAKGAFDEWARLPLEERSRYLIAFGKVLRAHHPQLAEVISKETGKPLWDSLSEVEAMIKKVDLTLEAYQQRCPQMVRDLPQARSITRHHPHGVAAVFGPYNFPGHLPNGHILPALLAGNTIVFKPSELTPLVAEETLRLWEQVHLPPGVLNLVQGGRETGQALAHHADLNALFFTGSYPTGQMLSELFAKQTGKMLALELGGNNPLIVGEISNLQAAAYTILQSAYLSTGQRCTCARRLIIPDNQLGSDLIDILFEMICSISIGPYTQSPEPFMGPLISETHVNKLLEAQANLKNRDGEIILDMRPLKGGTGFISPGLMDVTPIKERPDEEIFGPFLQVIRVADLQEAVKVANQTKYGLTAGLLSDKPEEYNYFFQHVLAGVINWNTPLTGASSAAPFGGIKGSGNFRPSAYYAADYCSYPVASLEASELKMPSFFLPGIKVS